MDVNSPLVYSVKSFLRGGRPDREKRSKFYKQVISGCRKSHGLLPVAWFTHPALGPPRSPIHWASWKGTLYDNVNVALFGNGELSFLGSERVGSGVEKVYKKEGFQCNVPCEICELRRK